VDEERGGPEARFSPNAVVEEMRIRVRTARHGGPPVRKVVAARPARDVPARGLVATVSGTNHLVGSPMQSPPPLGLPGYLGPFGGPGYYRLIGVPPGTYRLRCTKDGYATQESEVTLTGAGSRVVYFQLQPL
jgi:hypothetical protein